MTRTARRPVCTNPRSWAIHEAPRRLVAVILGVELLAVVSVVASASFDSPGLRGLALALFLSAVAVVFEEFVVRATRLQLRLSADLKRDMTSVWAVAGAAALAPSAAALLLTIVYGHVWLRQQRPAGEQLFRKVFNLANTVTSCTAACAAIHAARPLFASLPGALPASLAVILALVCFGVTNRLIITAALLSLGLPARKMLGSRDDNLIEIATLCLGGLVALAVIYEPLLAVLVVAPMVTMQRGAAMRELEAAATTDAKTGLLNAVAWEQIASRELLRAAREGGELGVLIIDIDHFKRVNDRYGHLVGDIVLRRLARTLSTEVREYDTVARFGGEEFVAVLPTATTNEALLIAERLRSRVSEIWMSSIVVDLDPALDANLTVSVGVATAPMDGVELPDLLHAADGALYRAKDNGRNRVELADSGHGGELQALPFG